MQRNKKPEFFDDALVTRANTDISEIKMERRNCRVCGNPYSVYVKSKHKECGRLCSSLPTSDQWNTNANRKKVADHYDKPVERKHARSY